MGRSEQRLRTRVAFVDFVLAQGQAVCLARCYIQDKIAFDRLISNEQLNIGEVARVLVKLGDEVVVEAKSLVLGEMLAAKLFAGEMVQQAEQLMQAVVHLQEKSRGPKAPLTARSILVDILTKLGQFDMAEALGWRELALAEQAYGVCDGMTACAKLTLAEVLISRGREQQAEANVQGGGQRMSGNARGLPSYDANSPVTCDWFPV